MCTVCLYELVKNKKIQLLSKCEILYSEASDCLVEMNIKWKVPGCPNYHRWLKRHRPLVIRDGQGHWSALGRGHEALSCFTDCNLAPKQPNPQKHPASRPSTFPVVWWRSLINSGDDLLGEHSQHHLHQPKALRDLNCAKGCADSRHWASRSILNSERDAE